MSFRQTPLFLAAGLAAGTLSGLFGVGGGIILVPMLVFWFKFRQKDAQATSLAAIVLTAAAGAVPYSLAEHIDWLAAGLIVGGGVVGSSVGASVAHRVEDRWLRLAFAAVAVASALKLLLDAPAASGAAPPGSAPGVSAAVVLSYLGAGLAMGLLSALLGVGGGIVLVPLLALLIGLPQTAAQGLSLVVMAPISLVGALRHARNGYTNWAAGLALGVGGAIMSPIAAGVALRLPATILPKLFALLLLFTAAQLVRKALRPQPRAGKPTAGPTG